MPSSSRPRTCVFCSDPHAPLTEEHLFADWVSKSFGDIGSLIELRNAEGEIAFSWKGTAFQDVLKIVCDKNCNNGWMSDLENKVSPILGPMMETLTTSQQANLASWAVKTVLVADHLDRLNRFVPDSEYQAWSGIYGLDRASVKRSRWVPTTQCCETLQEICDGNRSSPGNGPRSNTFEGGRVDRRRSQYVYDDVCRRPRGPASFRSQLPFNGHEGR